MAIKTRQTDGTGVTNQDAALTNTELDTNFIELVAADATKQDILAEGAFADGDKTKLDGIATSATANPDAINNVVEDTTPQLGGNLDLNSSDITGTGNIDVTGTVTADGLTVDGASLTVDNGFGITSIGAVKYIADSDDNAPSTGSLHQFYTDNGTTAALVVQKSGNVGIGTSSPRALLDLGGGTGDGTLSNTTSQYQVVLEAPQGTGDYARNIGWAEGSLGTVAAINAVDEGTSSSTGLTFATGNNSAIAERMRIDSSGRVGIGCTPAERLQVQGATDNGLTLTSSDTTTGAANTGPYIYGSVHTGSGGGERNIGNIAFLKENATANNNAGYMKFSTRPASGSVTERMRIDSAGDLNLVNAGLSSFNFTTDGSLDYARITGGKSGSGIGELQFWTYSGGMNRAATIDKDGNLGIGTDSPNAKLDVNGGVVISPNTDGKDTFVFTTNASDDGRLQIKSDTTAKVDIQANGDSFFNGGNVGIGIDTPTHRLNVVSTSGTSVVQSIRNPNTSWSQYALTRYGSESADFRYMDFGYFRGAGSEALRGLVIKSQADDTLVTFLDNGNVGIGVTNPSDYYAENLVVAAADEGGITIECGATEKAYLMFADGTTGSAAYRGYLGYDHSIDALNVVSYGYINFYTGDPAVEAMRIDSSGNLTITGTVDGVDIATRDATLTTTTTTANAALPKTGGTVTGDITCTGGAGAITITSSDIRSAASSNWTGDPGTQGKIQYHSNRWYIVADSASNRIVQFRRNGTDVSYISNDGKYQGTATNADALGGVAASNYFPVAGGSITGNVNLTAGDELLVGGTFANNAYNSNASSTIYLGGGNDRINYSIGTLMENVGGNYTKLDLRWHTGIRMFARQEYGGFRYFSDGNMAANNKLFSIGESDSHTRVYYDLIVSGEVTVNSDERIKDNIAVIPDALEKVKAIRGITYTRTDIEDTETVHVGVIAQEVEAVLPEAVRDGDEGIKSVAYGNMVGLLIEAIKEQQVQIDELKAQVSRLSGYE